MREVQTRCGNAALNIIVASHSVCAGRADVVRILERMSEQRYVFPSRIQEGNRTGFAFHPFDKRPYENATTLSPFYLGCPRTSCISTHPVGVMDKRLNVTCLTLLARHGRNLKTGDGLQSFPTRAAVTNAAPASLARQFPRWTTR